MKKKIYKLCAFIAVFALISNTVFGQLSFDELSLSKSLFPEDSSFYKITSVRKDPDAPGFFLFDVTTDYTEYEIVSLPLLKKRLYEAHVIKELNSKSRGSGIAEGAVGSVVDTGVGVKNLVVHPVQSVKGLGIAAGKVGKSIGGIFRKPEEGERSSFGEKVIGMSKREIAKKVKVDVYSRNPVLQNKLDEFAKADLGGQGIVLVGSLLIPVVGIAAIILTATGINAVAMDIANDNSLTELYALNKKALIRLGGKEEEVTAFLNDTYYTPTEVTGLRLYLENLKDIRGYMDIMYAAFKLDSELAAMKLLYESQIAAEELKGDHGKMVIHVHADGLSVEDGKKLIFITPYDYLDSSQFSIKISQEAENERKRYGKSVLEIWNGGKVYPGFSSMFFPQKVKTRSMLLFESDKKEAEKEEKKKESKEDKEEEK